MVLDPASSVKSYDDLPARTGSSADVMPTLEMINERFARYFRTSLFNMLRRSADILGLGRADAEVLASSCNLFVPDQPQYRASRRCAASAVRARPQAGIQCRRQLLRRYRTISIPRSRDVISPTELRVVQILLRIAFSD